MAKKRSWLVAKSRTCSTALLNLAGGAHPTNSLSHGGRRRWLGLVHFLQTIEITRQRRFKPSDTSCRFYYLHQSLIGRLHLLQSLFAQ